MAAAAVLTVVGGVGVDESLSSLQSSISHLMTDRPKALTMSASSLSPSASEMTPSLLLLTCPATAAVVAKLDLAAAVEEEDLAFDVEGTDEEEEEVGAAGAWLYPRGKFGR